MTAKTPLTPQAPGIVAAMTPAEELPEDVELAAAEVALAADPRAKLGVTGFALADDAAAEPLADAAADDKATTFEPDEDLAQATAAAQQQVRILLCATPCLCLLPLNSHAVRFTHCLTQLLLYSRQLRFGSLQQLQKSTHSNQPDCIVLL